MKRRFVKKNFQVDTRVMIQHAERIMNEYERQGFKLTLRQLYYQFVARDIIPNKQTEYKRLGDIVNNARLAGLLDWDQIEDRTRNVVTPAAWSSPSQIIRAVADQYQEDLWRGQEVRPEVWIEKEALSGVVVPICEELRLPYLACRGYLSQSESYAAGQRFAETYRRGQRTIILHLGDHDPSGIDMTRDNDERLQMFAGYGKVEMRRLALNMDQIEQYNPPPNPAKETDSRFEDYKRNFGDESWELDALNPTIISDLIRDAVDEFRDMDQWDEKETEETAHKKQLQLVSRNWADVVKRLEDAPDEEEPDEEEDED